MRITRENQFDVLWCNATYCTLAADMIEHPWICCQPMEGRNFNMSYLAYLYAVGAVLAHKTYLLVGVSYKYCFLA